MTMMEEKTEIVQMPAIYRNGECVAILVDWHTMDANKLNAIAKSLHGTLGYRKMRATYSDLEVELCNHYECHNPAVKGTFECERHNG